MSAFAWDSHRTTKDSTDKEQDPPHKSEQHDEHKLPPAPDASTEDTPAKPEDVDAPKLSLEQPTRPNFPSHFDSDKKDTSASFNFSTLAERTNSSPASMPHRVEPYPMTSSHRRHYEYDHHHRRPSPPPITTLPHSPTPSVSSLDRSAVSTPPIRRSPPLHNQTMPGPPPHLYASPYPPDPALLNRHFRPEHQHLHHGYMYAPPPPHHPMDQRPYDPQPQQDGSPYHGSAALPPHMVPTMRTDQHQHQHHHYGPPPPQHQSQHGHAYPGQPGLSIVHTDDAATKLSDRVRRRCFNCCTTDTSTWRRSNLSPGKVLCNKCGLFERTHSRPRPEQFPHKRGPLSTSTLRARTPPQTQLPPMSPGFHYTHPPPPPHHQHPQHQHQGQQHQGQQQQYGDSRREYAHAPPPPGSVAASHSGSSNGSGGGVGGGAGNGNGTTLPGLQTWHHEPAAGTGSPRMHPPPPPSTSRRSTLDNTGPGSAGGSRGASPPLSRPASGQGQGQGQGGRGEGEQPAASASAAAAAAA